MRAALYRRLPILAQNWACSLAGYQMRRARYTPHFYRMLTEWESTQGGPLELLHAYQRTRLDRLVERARAHTEHYRALDLPPPSNAKDPFEAIGQTLSSFPPLDKSTYRANPRSFIASDIPPRRLLVGHTSGTTGSALPLWHTAETLAEEFAVAFRLRLTSGLSLDDPYLSFGGKIIVPIEQQHPPYWRNNRAGHQTLFSLYHMKPESLVDYVKAVHTIPARYVHGYPSSIHLVGRAMLKAGRPLPPGRITAVFTSSESLLAFQRDTIEEAFGAPVRDRYGSTEFAVSMTACSEQRLHVDMEYCIVEVEVQEEGDTWERGPLLVTGLSNDATPFIRYRIGDIGTRLKGPCGCGRPGDAFLDVDGRVEDYVVTPDGRQIGRVDHIFKDQHDVAEAQIVQETKDSIEIFVVASPTWSSTSGGELMKTVRSFLGEELEIEVRRVESIPREANGKFRAVKSQVGRLEA
jgi:phenylacetate-CoA ligase